MKNRIVKILTCVTLLTVLLSVTLMSTAFAYVDFIETLTFTSMPKTAEKVGGKWQLTSDPVLAAGQNCSIVASMAFDGTRGGILLRAEGAYRFKYDLDSLSPYIFDLTNTSIGYWCTIPKQATAIDEGALLDENGVAIINNIYGSAIAQEGDLMIPIKLSPATGDNSNVALWAAMFAIGAVGLCAFAVYGKKKLAHN